MAKLKNPVLLAVVGAAHGIKGESRIKTFTGDPLALGGYGPLFDKNGRAFEILDIRPQGTVVVVRFKGLKDRNEAEALTGTELFVERGVLSTELDDEEFYHTDLVGMDVLDEGGATIGRVSAVQNYGAGDILEVKGPGLDTLIPFTKTAVPVVDVAMRTIRIDPVAAGLVENSDDGDEPDRLSQGEDGFDPRRRPPGPREAGGNR